MAAFFSYSRNDSDWALRLAKELKASGANVWLDQLDIKPGQRWAGAVEKALADCASLLVILSPSSVESTNVMDEVSFALEEQKPVIPVLVRDCKIPFRLRRLQYIDLRSEYNTGLKQLIKTLTDDEATVREPPVSVDIETIAAGETEETQQGRDESVTRAALPDQVRLHREAAEADQEVSQEQAQPEALDQLPKRLLKRFWIPASAIAVIALCLVTRRLGWLTYEDCQRADRDGNGLGRVYTLKATCSHACADYQRLIRRKFVFTPIFRVIDMLAATLAHQCQVDIILFTPGVSNRIPVFVRCPRPSSILRQHHSSTRRSWAYASTASPRNTAALRRANSAKVVGRTPKAAC